jgi:hypothetical protein
VKPFEFCMNKFFILFFFSRPTRMYIKNEFSIITLFPAAMKYLHFHQMSSANRKVNGRKMSIGGRRSRVNEWKSGFAQVKPLVGVALT